MLVIGGIKVPPVNELSPDECRDLIDKIINFAKSNPQGPERETFDFKRQLNIPHKGLSMKKREELAHELRKLFSSFANTHGGLVIVGVDEKKGFAVTGTPTIPKDEQLTQILADKHHIRPPLNFYSQAVTYQNKTVLLYYIPKSHGMPVEVRKSVNEPWQAYCRRNNITDVLTTIEVMLKLHPGIRRLPPHACVDTSQLGYYPIPDEEKRPFIKWTVKKPGEIYRWLEAIWMPLIPIPLPAIPFWHSPEVYVARTSWHGDPERLLEILTDIEDKVQEAYGIGYEAWSAPLKGPRTYLEDRVYISGCGAQNLQKCIESQDLNKFAWFIAAKSVSYIVIGEIHERHCEISVQGMINFIPNNFPFISIDEVGRVTPEPLPVNKMSIEDLVKEWRQKISEKLWLEDLPGEALTPLPSAQIIGYLGEKPKPRSYDFPFRARGLTVLEIRDSDKLMNTPPLINNVNPLLCHVGSAPRGLNDLEEVKVVGTKLRTLLLPQYPIHDLTVVLFSINSYINQSKSYRLQKKE